MTREEILSSPEYWITSIQIEVYRCADAFMKAHNMNRTQLADYLGVTKGYISQILAGNYNYSLSKLVDTAMRLGYVPEIDFTPLSEKIQDDIICSQVKTDTFVFTYSDNNPKLTSAA